MYWYTVLVSLPRGRLDGWYDRGWTNGAASGAVAEAPDADDAFGRAGQRLTLAQFEAALAVCGRE